MSQGIHRRSNRAKSCQNLQEARTNGNFEPDS